MVDTKSFEGTRVRLQRLSDAKLFSGWLKKARGNHFSIQTDAVGVSDQPEPFMVQAFGDEHCLICTAILLRKASGVADFGLEGNPRFIDSHEDMRLQVEEGMRCKLKLGWFEAWCDVVDVSFRGLGLRSVVPVDRSEKVEILITSFMGEITGEGEVRYCRALNGVEGVYRVGVKLEPFDRLNTARWQRLFQKLSSGQKDAA